MHTEYIRPHLSVAHTVHKLQYRIFSLSLAYYVYTAYLCTFVGNKYGMIAADHHGYIRQLVVQPARHFCNEGYGCRPCGKADKVGRKAFYLVEKFLSLRHIQLVIKLYVMTSALYDSGDRGKTLAVVSELVFAVFVLLQKVWIYKQKSFFVRHFVVLSFLHFLYVFPPNKKRHYLLLYRKTWDMSSVFEP